jgi:hypothetical protein
MTPFDTKTKWKKISRVKLKKKTNQSKNNWKQNK